MTVPCQVVTVNAPPAKITAISINVSPSTCTTPCNVTATVVWRNDGGVSGTFIPAIKVNATRITQAMVTLVPGQSVTRNFSIPGLVNGKYTICPDPN